MTPTKALEIALATAGGLAALAALLGGKIKRQNVEGWVRGGRVPVVHCPAVERAVEGRVVCEELQPDGIWTRIPDPAWPWAAGRPVFDPAKSAESVSA